jgi:hypothetical protein
MTSRMNKSSYLTAQLRESAPYLRDAGWHQTAQLLVAAADEIEALRAQLRAAGPSADQYPRARSTSSKRRPPA